MTPLDLRLDAAFIVPVEPARTLAEHALLVDGGRIVELVPRAVADRDFKAREHVAHRFARQRIKF